MVYYLNGEFVSDSVCTINIGDRGLLLGDGVFTTLKSINGTFIHFNEHIERLNNNAAQIKINAQFDVNKIRDICQLLLSQNDLDYQDAITRITITRGVADRGINIPPQDLQYPTILIRTVPFHDTLRPALKLCSTSIVRNEKSILTTIKSLNYLESILAREEALLKGYDDGIMFNSLGNITESSVANIFFVNSNQDIITPAISDGVLPGVVRNAIISICRKLDIKCNEQSIKISEVESYTAGFLTNSVFGIKPLSLVNNIKFLQTEPIIQIIHEKYAQSISCCG
jgi:branched-chain amino acid aminotransferase